ncbi:MAG: hypothetical protein KAV82_12340 [Phycisphaerae bacterium]|nr:hypothetical protein [Phycisphaerae bacterium]
MNTDHLTQFAEQVHGLWQTNIPPEYQVPVFPVAVGMLVIGIGLSVLGAKLARWGITCAFGAAGVAVAAALAPGIDLSTIAVIVIGAIVAGGIGYWMFRLWVGLAAAALFGVVAVGFYGSHAVVPHFLEYQSGYDFNNAVAMPQAGDIETFTAVYHAEDDKAGTVSLARTFASEAGADALSGLRAWAEDFWVYVQSQEADVNKWIPGIGLAAGLIGFLLGVFRSRFTLILGTAMVGITLVMSGLAGLAAKMQLNVPQAIGQHTQAICIAGVLMLLASILLQALLTRKVPGKTPAPQEQ